MAPQDDESNESQGKTVLVKEYSKVFDTNPHINRSVQNFGAGCITLSPESLASEQKKSVGTLTVACEMVRIPFFTTHFLLCHTLRILREVKENWMSCLIYSRTTITQ